MAYLPIFNSQIDADSPLLSSSLGHRLRDNPEAMHAGDVGAPKFLFPPGRGTSSGLLRPDCIGGVRVGPYGAGLPPTLIISSGTFTIPLGVRRIIVEAWGAGALRNYDAGGQMGQYGKSGHWGRSLFTVNPGEVLTLVVGSTANQSTSTTGSFGTMVAKGGDGGVASPGALCQEFAVLLPARSGGHQRTGAGDDGPRVPGGGAIPSIASVARGAVLLRGIP